MIKLRDQKDFLAHKWVLEQAELGARTDHRKGLSEYLIDAAHQAFEAGWDAAMDAVLSELGKSIKP